MIIGASESGAKLTREIERYPQLGYTIAGFIDDDGRKKDTICAGHPIFGTYSDIGNVVKREDISGIIISHVSTSANEIMKILFRDANLFV